MIEIVIDTIGNIDKSRYRNYLSIIPKHMVEDILKYRLLEDRYRTLIGKVLLFKLLKKYTNYTLLDIKYTNYKKPYIPDSNIDFNISHSGESVIIVFAINNDVGIDIESIKNIDLKDFETVFLENEFKIIENSKNKLENFYNFWTLKEATLKLQGKGLLGDLKEVLIDKDYIFFQKQKYNYFTLKYQKNIFSLVYANRDKINISIENN